MEKQKEMIRVVYCEPGKLAGIKEIGTELEDLQRAVGGLIETCYLDWYGKVLVVQTCHIEMSS